MTLRHEGRDVRATYTLFPEGLGENLTLFSAPEAVTVEGFTGSDLLRFGGIERAPAASPSVFTGRLPGADLIVGDDPYGSVGERVASDADLEALLASLRPVDGDGWRAFVATAAEPADEDTTVAPTIDDLTIAERAGAGLTDGSGGAGGEAGPGRRLLEQAGQAEADVVAVVAGGDLEADREAAGGEPGRDRDRRVPAEVGQHGERRGHGPVDLDPGDLGRRRALGGEGGHGGGGREHHVDLGEQRGGVELELAPGAAASGPPCGWWRTRRRRATSRE